MPKKRKKGNVDRLRAEALETGRAKPGRTQSQPQPGVKGHAQACIRNLEREWEWLHDDVYDDWDSPVPRGLNNPNKQRELQACSFITKAIQVLRKVR